VVAGEKFVFLGVLSSNDAGILKTRAPKVIEEYEDILLGNRLTSILSDFCKVNKLLKVIRFI
jgi:hypothetical protein